MPLHRQVVCPFRDGTSLRPFGRAPRSALCPSLSLGCRSSLTPSRPRGSASEQMPLRTRRSWEACDRERCGVVPDGPWSAAASCPATRASGQARPSGGARSEANGDSPCDGSASFAGHRSDGAGAGLPEVRHRQSRRSADYCNLCQEPLAPGPPERRRAGARGDGGGAAGAGEPAPGSRALRTAPMLLFTDAARHNVRMSAILFALLLAVFFLLGAVIGETYGDVGKGLGLAAVLYAILAGTAYFSGSEHRPVAPRRGEGRPGAAPAAPERGRGDADRRRPPDAEGLRDAVRRDERLRRGEEPEGSGRRGDAGAARPAQPRGAAGGDRPRAGARQGPGHPLLHLRRRARRRHRPAGRHVPARDLPRRRDAGCARPAGPGTAGGAATRRSSSWGSSSPSSRRWRRRSCR